MTLDGLGDALRDPSLRAILVEVHSAILSDAGIPDAPRQVIDTLRSAGLTRQTWLDASHLLGEREAPEQPLVDPTMNSQVEKERNPSEEQPQPTDACLPRRRSS